MSVFAEPDKGKKDEPDEPVPVEPIEPTPPPTLRSGITLSMSNKALGELRQVIVNYIPDDDLEFDLPDYCPKFKVALGTVEMCQTNQKIRFSQIDRENIKMSLHKESPQFEATLTGIAVDYKMDFFMSSKPSFTEDQGDGYAKTKNATITLLLDPVRDLEHNGELKAEVVDIKVDFSDIDADLNGETDITNTLGHGVNHLKNYVRSELVEILEKYSKGKIEENLNNIIRIYSQVFPIDMNVGINSTLATDVMVGKGFAAIPFDGSTIMLKEPEAEKFGRNFYPIMPAYIPEEEGGKDVQLFVSEDAANQLLQNLIDTSMELDQTVKIETVNELFPEFVDIFGPKEEKKSSVVSLWSILGKKKKKKKPKKKKHDSTHMVLKLEENTVPYMILTEGLITMRAEVELHIKNPKNLAMDAAVLYAVADATMTAKMKRGQEKIIGTLKTLDVSMTDINPLFATETTVEDLQDEADSLATLMKLLIGSALKEGYEIELPEELDDVIDEDMSFSVKDHYALLQFNTYEWEDDE